MSVSPPPSFTHELKRAVELAYRDRPVQILDYGIGENWIGGEFRAGVELFDFEITPRGIRYIPKPTTRTDAYDLGVGAAFHESATLNKSSAYWLGYFHADKADQCTIGRSCGEACVSKDKTCDVDSPQAQRAAQNAIAQGRQIIYKEHQLRIAERLKEERGLIVYHGLGSGKTLTAINAAEGYGGAVVVTPASLRENFKKELKTANAQGKYEVYSYEEFTKRQPDLTGRMLIVDEAHRLKNTATQRTQAIAEQSKAAEKVLLLTGTPIQNKPHEIAPLVNIAAGADVLPTSYKAFNDLYIDKKRVDPGWFRRTFFREPAYTIEVPKNMKDFKEKAGRHTDYYIPTREGYPSVTHETSEVPMTKEQVFAYRIWERQLNPVTRMRIQKSLPPGKDDIGNLNVFINGQRQISNTAVAFNTRATEPAPKVQAIATRVEESPGRSLIYSNYLDSGVSELSKELNRKGIAHRTFTGTMNDREKKEAVSDYNSGKIKALIVSSSGGEGLDLKQTRQVHLMEPHWYNDKLEQVMGRAIRYKSHEGLGEDQQNVTVYQYLSALPGWAKRNRDEKTADQYLHELSQKKSELNWQFLAQMQNSVPPTKR